MSTLNSKEKLMDIINSRSIPGNGGSVVWYLADGSHWIQVRGAAFEHVSLREYTRGFDAHQAFEHPFVDPNVPDIFKREVLA